MHPCAHLKTLANEPFYTLRARDRDYRCPGHLRGPRVNAQRLVCRGRRLKGTRVYHVEQETEGKLINSGRVGALFYTVVYWWPVYGPHVVARIMQAI